MSDAPLADLKSLDYDRLAGPERWAQGLAEVERWTAALHQPFDDVPDFDNANDPEVSTTAGLANDRSHVRLASRRLFVDYRGQPDARRHVERLPEPGESVHGVVCGKYAAWDLVPALIERVGQPISDLHIATLSYGRENAAQLLGLLDDGHVRRVSLLVSYYFKAQNRGLYDSLVPGLRERGHRVLAMRTHCKLLLIRFADGTTYVHEGSANLRSCKNVEQWVLTRDDGLYAFHRGWIESELLHGKEEGTDDGDH